MNKAEIMKAARAKREADKMILKGKDLSLADYQAEYQRISNEFKAIKEANKPTHQRLSVWQKANNASFQRWYAKQQLVS